MVIDDLAQRLVDDGVDSLGPSGNIWVAFMPPEGDTAIALYPTGGLAMDAVMDRVGPAYETHNVQVTSRASSYSTATANVEAAYTSLCRILNQTINGTFYLSVTALQPPFFLTKDDNERWIFAFNVQVVKAT